jgi:O-antigen/teichoic acid export membrane protein
MIFVNLKNELVRNSVWMLLGQGLKLVIQALYFVAIARSLGIINYGAFIGVVALVGVAVPFADLGRGNLLVKNVSRDVSRFADYWGSALVATALSGCVLFVAVLVVSRFALPASIPLRLIELVALSDLFGLNLITVCGQAFLAFDRLKWTAGITVLGSISRLIGACVLIMLRPRPSPLQWGYVYFTTTSVVAAVAVALVWVKIGRPKMNARRANKELCEGLYFSTGLCAQTIYNDIDKTMLARLGSLEAAGIYGAAYRLIDVSFVPVSSLLMASYASFFRSGAGGVSACFAYAKPLLWRALGYSVLAFGVLELSAGLVPHILGAQYLLTAQALRWLALLPVLKVGSYFFSNILAGTGYQGVRSGFQLGLAFFNVIVNLWVIPTYSWRGAAWSSLASDGILAGCACGAVCMIARREGRDASKESAPALA